MTFACRLILHFGKAGYTFGNVIEAICRLPCPDLRESCLTNLQVAVLVITKRQLRRNRGLVTHTSDLQRGYKFLYMIYWKYTYPPCTDA